MKFFAKKEIELKSATIHLHYANNRGRGASNVTITIVRPNATRQNRVRGYNKSDIISQYRTCGWRGNVNITSKTINQYGGLN